MFQNLIHRAVGTTLIHCAELIGVNHQVIQPIEVQPFIGARIQRVDCVIRGIEVRVKATKDGGNPQVEFSITVERSGINQCRTVL